LIYFDYTLLFYDFIVYYFFVQFQARGTPHVHALIAVANDGIKPEDITSQDEERRKLVMNLVKRTVTAELKHSANLSDTADEYDYLWRPVHEPAYTGIEDYTNDIRRLVFRPTMDFRLDENNEFLCPVTRQQYYAYQCTNQMHTCMETCWKYNYSTDGEKHCRFHYPISTERSSSDQSTIYSLYDSKKRKQTKINAPRNNGWVNPLPTHPLVVFANQGNMDLQYISNANGAVEYTCGYISKQDEPDEKMLINLFVKKLAHAILHSNTGDATKRQQLCAAGNAIAASQQVGTVQCAYVLLNLPFVIKSRIVSTISPQPTAVLTKNIITDMRQLEQMNPGDSAVSTSARSHAGRRLAYHLLCEKQYSKYGMCNVSLFTIVSTYAITKPQRCKKDGTVKPVHDVPFLEINDFGKYTLLITYCLQDTTLVSKMVYRM